MNNLQVISTGLPIVPPLTSTGEPVPDNKMHTYSVSCHEWIHAQIEHLKYGASTAGNTVLISRFDLNKSMISYEPPFGALFYLQKCIPAGTVLTTIESDGKFEHVRVDGYSKHGTYDLIVGDTLVLAVFSQRSTMIGETISVEPKYAEYVQWCVDVLRSETRPIRHVNICDVTQGRIVSWDV